MRPYRIVLADDHALLRQGLRKILEGLGDLQVVGEASDGLELLAILKEVISDMIILDISMPNLRGIEAIREIKAAHSDVKILVLTMHKEREYLYQAISAGAHGYLLKEDADTELSSAIETIRRRKMYVSPLLAKELADGWAQRCRGKTTLPFELEQLTTRERQILKLIGDGKTSREIGDLLFISFRTVERHRANLMGKLKMKKIADLVKYAIQKGYV